MKITLIKISLIIFKLQLLQTTTLDFLTKSLNINKDINALNQLMREKEIEKISQTNDSFIEKEYLQDKKIEQIIEAVANDRFGLIEELSKTVSLSRVYENTTALAIATQLNKKEMIDFLIEKGADIATVFDKKDVCWLALSLGNNELFKKYLMLGALVNFNYEGKNRLIEAVELSNVEAVKTLLNFGVNVDFKDNNGRTALHYNLRKSPYTQKDKAITVLLLAVDLDLNQLDNLNIPAYGYLDSLYDIRDLTDINELKPLTPAKQNIVKQVKQSDKPKDTIIKKYKDVVVDRVQRPKSFKSYYMPKLGGKKK